MDNTKIQLDPVVKEPIIFADSAAENARIDEKPKVKRRLFIAFELGWGTWKLGFSTDRNLSVSTIEIRARDLKALFEAIRKAKAKFHLPDDTPIFSCYESGRDGFWLHRYLELVGIVSVVVDPGSMKVNGRRRRAKTDRLDAKMLLDNLRLYLDGEVRVWSVVMVPGVDDEERRYLNRELRGMAEERTRHVNSIKGILAGVGISLRTLTANFPQWLSEERAPDGNTVSNALQMRLLREFERWQLVNFQMFELEQEQLRRIREAGFEDKSIDKVRRLLSLKGIGPKSAWLLTMELWGWRQFRNVKHLGAFSGLTPTPFNSGASQREQGISKAGNQQSREPAGTRNHGRASMVLVTLATRKCLE